MYLPGLHVIWGDLHCTHTKRELPVDRFVSVQVKKLSYNYYCLERGEKITILCVT